MFIRQAARRVAVGVVSVSAASAFSIAMLAGPAGAAAPTEGSIVPNSAVPIGTVASGAAFSSGQQIDVVIPANSVFTNPNQNINILQCAAPNGVPPTTPNSCDGNTINGESLDPNADGSFDYQSFSGSAYTVYNLPDKPELGENPGGVTCGNTAATECILYIGVNQLDFTQPHVWSQPFFISPATGADAADNGTNPGDGSQPGAATPEVPLAILLPVAAMGLIGGTVVIRRRRLGRVSSNA
jgi:hypothetical protein